ncbi:MAG: hypothetical protein B7Z80_24710 [Rhodospirillales bacterium 20-64-7]|nr:MAG: hypothetical protein B7Z80_24710 [Rhodospirillales bacterium 20-64-7]
MLGGDYELRRFITRRNSHLRRKFGITLDQYNELSAKQNDCCAICDKHRTEFDKEFAVDHNENTGEIRGLLCFYCNYKLVADHTDGTLLRKVADYVEGGIGLFVNG